MNRSRGDATGYRHSGYAESLAEFGTPRHLPYCDGWILEREVPGGFDRDGMGCYPLFSCGNWDGLAADLEAIGDELVSLALVADPFGEHCPELLSSCLPDVYIPFKNHFAIDLEASPEAHVSRTHQRNARKGLQLVTVDCCNKPGEHLDDWIRLYENLTARHKISGVAAFSRTSFGLQMEVPGLVTLRAERDGATVGMLLWYVQGPVAHYHLGAFDEIGYETHASFALFWRSIEIFRASGLRWLNLGGGAGVRASQTDGLTRFKAGWSSHTRTAYFCGRTFDRRRAEEIAALHGAAPEGYFPPYRAGEFQ